MYAILPTVASISLVIHYYSQTLECLSHFVLSNQGSDSSIVLWRIIGMPQNISYTTIASILLKEINKVRNDPKLLIPVLQQRISKYDEQGNYFPLTGLNFSVKTKEGTAGVRNLISYLQNQRECPQLNWSYELHQAADKRAHFLSSTQDNKNLNRIANLDIGELVSEFVLWKGSLIELTFYGFIEPKQFICELLLEDGHTLKQNRDHFFNRTCSYLGLAISTHPTYRFVVVLIMANQVIKHVPFDIYRNTLKQQTYQPQAQVQAPSTQQNVARQPTCDIQVCRIY